MDCRQFINLGFSGNASHTALHNWWTLNKIKQPDFKGNGYQNGATIYPSKQEISRNTTYIGRFKLVA